MWTLQELREHWTGPDDAHSRHHRRHPRARAHLLQGLGRQQAWNPDQGQAADHTHSGTVTLVCNNACCPHPSCFFTQKGL